MVPIYSGIDAVFESASMIRVHDIVEYFDAWAPPFLAEDWDTVGLQIGGMDWEVGAVTVALDPSARALEKAVATTSHLLITHHPLFFKPLKNITFPDPVAGFVEKALRHGIALFSAHTNLDAAWGGVNDALARVLGIEVRGVLDEGPADRMAKFVTFVPKDHLDAVRRAAFESGGGRIGNYSHCSFNLEGTGTFLPHPGARPFTGEVGRMEEAGEVRFELLVPKDHVAHVLDRVREAHPYEEMAYDVYPLGNPTHRGGMGRIGRLAHPMELGRLARMVAQTLEVDHVRTVGDPDKMVQSAALCGGSGAGLWGIALSRGADVFITGEMGYHQALEADGRGLAVIEVGHFASEKPVLSELAGLLEERFGSQDPEFTVHVFKEQREVFRYL